ncbi:MULTISPECIES: hypothetical protein [Burkholderia cepacia complex]|uniref:Uncharacterized protein n=1 Tax=Burkholderia orbicola (strain MC0-3) TaxID=406425 RepID=B1JUL9_BURO0|nr:MULTISPECIES: hypothetical protein [Burkholderia cepacia complex]ACA89605.1 hypothetical protein Bcenmc03_0425 [Burkholderia orbicola MC0-3]
MGNVQPLQKLQSPPSPSKSLIDALRDRCSLPDLRAALKKQNLPCGVAWSDVQGHADEKSTNGEKVRAFLAAYHIDSILAAEKFIKFYDLDAALAKTIEPTLKNAVVSKSDFSPSYPLPLTGAALSSATSDPTLVEVRELGGGDYALVYCSVRSYDDRTQYKYDQLPQNVKQTYGDIDQLITIRKVYFQAYDAVIIRPSLERIEVLLDQPKKTGRFQFDAMSIKVFSALANNIPALVPVYQSDAVNIFNAVSGIYYAPKEGVVRSLAFRTLTGSRKHERMITEADDLRSETFHHAGVEAVGNKIRPYELEVEWNFTLQPGKALLSLSAHIRELNMETPKLTGCLVAADSQVAVLQAINKIVAYLT